MAGNKFFDTDHSRKPVGGQQRDRFSGKNKYDSVLIFLVLLVTFNFCFLDTLDFLNQNRRLLPQKADHLL
jgi:hypothetical protein